MSVICRLALKNTAIPSIQIQPDDSTVSSRKVLPTPLTDKEQRRIVRDSLVERFIFLIQIICIALLDLVD